MSATFTNTWKSQESRFYKRKPAYNNSPVLLNVHSDNKMTFYFLGETSILNVTLKRRNNLQVC